MPKKVTRRTAPYDFILERDRELPPAEQSRFRIQPPNQRERAAMLDDLTRTLITADDKRFVVSRSHVVAYNNCLAYIVAVENFPAGAPEQWPADQEARARYLEGLDLEAIRELGNEIFASGDPLPVPGATPELVGGP